MIVECPGCKLKYDVGGRPPGTRARCRCNTVFELPSPDENAAALSCPNCGAPADADSTKCGYCSVELARARCSACFALMFQQAKHCHKCGAAADAPARALHDNGRTQFQCPRCDESLVANVVGGALLDQCPKCGGLWLDHAVFERLLDDAEQRQRVSTAVGGAAPPKQHFNSREVVYLKCPECEVLMNRKNFSRYSGVIVDICSAHGVWFDYQELANIITWVRDGGLQSARKRDADKARTQRRNAPTPTVDMLTHDVTHRSAGSIGIDLLVEGISRLFR
ncbi:MAG: zf-TFIIB domain-containing protein [Pseudomonadota bacterium]